MRSAILALTAVVSLCADAATVRVRVVDASTNQPIAKAYSAVVAEDAPWSQPARESIGGSSHDVPPGRYRVVALARGYTTEYERPFTLDANATRDVTLALKPLALLNGTVLGVDGTPIFGARVGFTGTFTYDHAAALSPVAEELLRANTVTTTNADGAFTLPALPEGRMVIVLEANRHAPRVFEDARAGDLGAIAVAPGAALVVRWSGPGGSMHDRISLLPQTVPPGLTRERAIDLWTRPLSGNGATWTSLPPGAYDIVLRGRPRAPHDVVPVHLASATLVAGEQKTVEVVLPPSATTPQPARSPLRLLARDAKLDALAAARVTFWSDKGAERVDAELAPASGGTLLTLVRNCAAGGITIEIVEAIGAASVRSCDAPTSFTLHRKAAIAAKFTAPPGAKVPQRGVARTAKCDFTIPFVIADGSAVISVPAACGDVVLALSTFAPVTIAARNLDPKQTHHAGIVQLREGGAVLARVRGIDGAPLANVIVKAHRQSDLDQLRGTTAPDAAATLATGTTDAQGWTRLYGLPAEDIVFSLRGPQRTRAHLTDTYRARTGEEFVLDDLTLPPPASIAVTLNLGGAAEEALLVHAVEAVPAEGNRWPARAPVATLANGARAVTIDDVPPGAWNIRALGRLTGGTLAVVGEKRVDVLPGASQQLTLDVADLVYRGRVLRGTSPVRGTIELQPAERGSDRRTATATLDDDGRFHVLLEGAGEYIASVQESHASRGARIGRAVRFEDPDDEVVIELPAGRISGRVVRGDGAPVAEASVSAHRAGDDATRGDMSGARSTADGTFVLESISAGSWSLRATASGAASEEVMVTATDGETGGVTLTVSPTRRVSIRVFEAAGQPARDATVFVEFPTASPAIHRTNAEGVVQVTIPQQFESNPTNVAVRTMDQRLSCATVRLDADRAIHLPAAHGEIRLRRRAWAPAAGVAFRLVAAEGCSVPFIAHRSGEEMIVPKLAAGTWHFVEMSSPQHRLFAFTGRASLLQPLATFTITPGRSTTIEIKD